MAPDDPNAPGFVVSARERAGPIDFVFSFYYRRLLAAQWLAMAKVGAFNLHGSLLPKYRGRSPVNWAVIQGERETGATLHVMNEKPDSGAIVDQCAVPILGDDTAREVFGKVVVAAEIVLVRSARLILTAVPASSTKTFRQGTTSVAGAQRTDEFRATQAPTRFMTWCGHSHHLIPVHSFCWVGIVSSSSAPSMLARLPAHWAAACGCSATALRCCCWLPTGAHCASWLLAEKRTTPCWTQEDS